MESGFVSSWTCFTIAGPSSPAPPSRTCAFPLPHPAVLTPKCTNRPSKGHQPRVPKEGYLRISSRAAKVRDLSLGCLRVASYPGARRSCPKQRDLIVSSGAAKRTDQRIFSRSGVDCYHDGPGDQKRRDLTISSGAPKLGDLRISSRAPNLSDLRISSHGGVSCSHHGTQREPLSFTHAVSSASAPLDVASGSPQEQHVEQLMNFYDENEFLFEEEAWGVWDDGEDGAEWPDWFQQNLALCVMAGRVVRSSQVLVVGGSAAFVKQLYHTASPTSLTVTHFSLSVLAAIKELDDDIICLHGSLDDLPDSDGDFDAVFLNSVVAISFSTVQLLQRVVSLCKPGARIVIGHSQGMENLEICRGKNPQLILYGLPDLISLRRMTDPLPVKLVEFQNETNFYQAVLEVEDSFDSLDSQNGSKQLLSVDGKQTQQTASCQKFPLRVGGCVVRGFGRGSSQMGIPTANVDPLGLPIEILALAKGVYFGWAQVKTDGLDGVVYKMVMNIGNRPTFGGEELTLEVHIMHFYDGLDFYGQELRVIVLGFIRNEMQFNSLGDLVLQINTDITTAERLLDDDKMSQYSCDTFFVRS